MYGQSVNASVGANERWPPHGAVARESVPETRLERCQNMHKSFLRHEMLIRQQRGLPKILGKNQRASGDNKDQIAPLNAELNVRMEARRWKWRRRLGGLRDLSGERLVRQCEGNQSAGVASISLEYTYLGTVLTINLRSYLRCIPPADRSRLFQYDVNLGTCFYVILIYGNRLRWPPSWLLMRCTIAAVMRATSICEVCGGEKVASVSSESYCPW
ncbi:hypothetical protein DFH06DRAFT_1144774 [Mycena polygramma]|nr:hypothetical protein DFH06DRAFT_1144774 [Mycena polygramma]